jgi:hypothetical protein
MWFRLAGAKLPRRLGGRREWISLGFDSQKPEGEQRQGCRLAPEGRRRGQRWFYCCSPQADRWILPQAKSNVLIRHGWRIKTRARDRSGNTADPPPRGLNLTHKTARSTRTGKKSRKNTCRVCLRYLRYAMAGNSKSFSSLFPGPVVRVGVGQV